MTNFIFGVDEAGRGPLAGPVAVAVFGIKKGFKIKKFPKGKDSKKMTPLEREYWFEIFNKEKQKGNVFFKCAMASSFSIDRNGIVPSIQKAMNECLKDLEKRKILNNHSKILLDGTLHAPHRFSKQKTIIKGDEKEILIACASIVAKVNRDRMMFRLAKKYPAYGFEKHKGYGTLEHRKKISKYGICRIHRKTYIK